MTRFRSFCSLNFEDLSDRLLAFPMASSNLFCFPSGSRDGSAFPQPVFIGFASILDHSPGLSSAVYFWILFTTTTNTASFVLQALFRNGPLTIAAMGLGYAAFHSRNSAKIDAVGRSIT